MIAPISHSYQNKTYSNKPQNTETKAKQTPLKKADINFSGRGFDWKDIKKGLQNAAGFVEKKADEAKTGWKKFEKLFEDPEVLAKEREEAARAAKAATNLETPFSTTPKAKGPLATHYEKLEDKYFTSFSDFEKAVNKAKKSDAGQVKELNEQIRIKTTGLSAGKEFIIEKSKHKTADNLTPDAKSILDKLGEEKLIIVKEQNNPFVAFESTVNENIVPALYRDTASTTATKNFTNNIIIPVAKKSNEVYELKQQRNNIAAENVVEELNKKFNAEAEIKQKEIKTQEEVKLKEKSQLAKQKRQEIKKLFEKAKVPDLQRNKIVEKVINTEPSAKILDESTITNRNLKLASAKIQTVFEDTEFLKELKTNLDADAYQKVTSTDFRAELSNAITMD